MFSYFKLPDRLCFWIYGSVLNSHQSTNGWLNIIILNVNQRNGKIYRCLVYFAAALFKQFNVNFIPL